jgi:hypothetical protein
MDGVLDLEERDEDPPLDVEVAWRWTAWKEDFRASLTDGLCTGPRYAPSVLLL